MKKLLLFLALLPALALAQLIGPGINTHAKQLPLKELRAIGIQWVRADLPIGTTTTTNAKWIVDHYNPLPVLWMLDNREPDPVKTAKAIYRAGIRHIEVCNEPDGEWFKQITPEAAADRFIQIYLALPSTVRLYGPSTAKWLPDYTERFVKRLQDKLGKDYREAVAALSVHLYWSRVDEIPSLVFESEKRWGLPMICTEVSSGSWADYPEKRGPAELFLALKKSLGLIAHCWYDGCENFDGDARGLFKWTGKEWVPTPTYQAILKGGITP